VRGRAQTRSAVANEIQAILHLERWNTKDLNEILCERGVVSKGQFSVACAPKDSARFQWESVLSFGDLRRLAKGLLAPKSRIALVTLVHKSGS
jgi:hypothetical protein